MRFSDTGLSSCIKWTLPRAAVLAVVVLACGCSRQPASGSASAVAVTTSYLECAVRDLAGDAVPVHRLSEPGMCPGHFDIRPSQIAELRQCRALLRFDFQAGIDSRLSSLSDDGLRILAIKPGEGMCVPAVYLDTCRQVATALIEHGWLDRPAADRRLGEIEQRMQRLTLETKNGDAGGEMPPGTTVLASGRQKAFCEFLGMSVAEVFPASDTVSPGELSRAIESSRNANTTLVIANAPEGTRLADSLAKRLNVPMVVFENFPAQADAEGFDRMVRTNLQRLREVR